MSYPEAFRSDGATYRDYRAPFLGGDPVSYGFANRALADFAIKDRLQTITYPVMVLAGAQDRLRPPDYVARLVQGIAGATYCVIDSGRAFDLAAHLMQIAEQRFRFLLQHDARIRQLHAARGAGRV